MQKYGELLRTLLEKRGIVDEAQADIFLNPDYKRDFHDPFLMRDMEKACVRLYESVENGEKVLKLVDFSVDNENKKELHLVLSEYRTPKKPAEIKALPYVDVGIYEEGKTAYTIPTGTNLGNQLSAVIYYMGIPEIVYAEADLGSP